MSSLIPLMKLVFALLTTGLLLVSGCDSSNSDTARNQPDADLQLELGETASSDGLTITFEAVASDSRCPEGMECIWAGEASVRLDIEGTPEELLVSDPERAPDAVIRRSDVIVRAIDLTPYPGSAGDRRGETPVVYIDTETDTLRRPIGTEDTIETDLAIELGQTRTASGLLIMFSQLEYDGRCPADAVCAWQGEAHVSLLIEGPRGTVEATAHVPGLTNGIRDVMYETDSTSVVLTELSPYPGTEEAYRGDPPTIHLTLKTVSE